MATKQHSTITGSDLHDPKAHATSHETGGSDAVSIRGICPIGSVIGWLKTTTNVPTLAAQGREEWEELNGQTISDADSPMDGQTLPDAIGTSDANRRYLRFNSTSGGTGGLSCHCHTGTACHTAFSCCQVSVSCGNDSCVLSGVSCSCGISYIANAAHLTPFLDVVPLVRIK